MPKKSKKEKEENYIVKPKEDVRIEKGNPKFNSVLSHFVPKKINKKDEGIK